MEEDSLNICNNNENNSKLNIQNDLLFPLCNKVRGMLSAKSKRMLTLLSDERSVEEFQNLLAELESFEFYKKFSNDARNQLAKKMVYTINEANSVLLQKGEIPTGMYIIVSGVVSLRYTMPSEMLRPNTPKHWPERILEKGDFFGHEDLIYGRASLVDIKCICYSELLKIKDEDFDIVRNVLQAENDILRQQLHSCEPLKRFNWNEEEFMVLEMFSDLARYFKEQEIYNGLSNTKNYWSIFVVSGECKLVREMSVLNQRSSQNQRSEVNKMEVHSSSLTCTKLVEFEKVRQGFYFAVGEEFGVNKVFASVATECLKVPKLLLMFKDKHLLEKMAHDVSNSLPTDKEILDNYFKYENTTQGTKKMIKELFKDKPERLPGKEKQNQKPNFIKYF